jgi:hypothetical protein
MQIKKKLQNHTGSAKSLSLMYGGEKNSLKNSD